MIDMEPHAHLLGFSLRKRSRVYKAQKRWQDQRVGCESWEEMAGYDGMMMELCAYDQGGLPRFLSLIAGSFREHSGKDERRSRAPQTSHTCPYWVGLEYNRSIREHPNQTRSK